MCTKSIRPLLILSTLLVCQAAFAGLQEAKASFLEGKVAYEQKDYEGALDAFQVSLMEDPDNLMLNHLIGQAAYELGDYEEALFAYERALVLDPKHAQSRLEKARTHLALGAKAEAKRELEATLEQDIPPDVRQNVRTLLSHIGSERKHTFGGVISLSHTFDSNANLGTTDFLPSPFNPSLTSSPSKVDDRIAAVALVLSHTYPLSVENLTWKNGVIFYLSDNDKLTANDLFLVTGNTGFVYSFKRHVIEGQVGYTHLKTDWSIFQNNVRFLLKYIHNYSKNIQLLSTTGYTKRHHYGSAVHFGLVSDSSSSIVYIIDPKRVLTATGLLRYDKSPVAGAEPMRYYRYQGQLAYNKTINEKWSANATGLIRFDRYRNMHAVHVTKKRGDDAYSLGGGLSFKAHPKVILGASSSFTHNRSNIPENNYDSFKFTTTATGIY